MSLINSLIAGLEPELNKNLTDAQRRLIERSLKRLRMLKEIAEKNSLTQEDITKAQKVLCFGNLGYCCSLSKKCIWRDCCREALGINNETFKEVKEQAVWVMLKRREQ